ncbi:MAG TPA: hypothetical protein VJU86_21500 [Pyrinomonadaceae bacterium]|nr:hypothetical protein [Pyrinomonadaceae bacterium]
MSKTNLPGFTADVSLFKTSGHYQTGTRGINGSSSLSSPIHPAMINTGGVNCSNCLGGECVELHCFESWTHGGGGAGGPYEGGGGGGGFGGGGSGPSRRNCRDQQGKIHRHGTSLTTTVEIPPGGPENTYIVTDTCRNGRWV